MAKASFIKKRISLADLGRIKHLMSRSGLHTVCESARCPNIGECFSCGTATFLIAGDICTRGCRFCAIQKGTPQPLDPHEPENIADMASTLSLKYAVITSVTRDDLPDGGAGHFARTIACLRERLPGTKVEVLVPDFAGKKRAASIVFSAQPDVFAHNLETVPRLYTRVRAGAGYRRSLTLLARAKQHGLTTKSGIMLGLGEHETEVHAVMDDLRAAGCDILTLGQYLAASKATIPVHGHVSVRRFNMYRSAALRKGFRSCASAPFVRSSYLAETMLAGM